MKVFELDAIANCSNTTLADHIGGRPELDIVVERTVGDDRLNACVRLESTLLALFRQCHLQYNLTFILFRGYTPTFNDGDACTHSCSIEPNTIDDSWEEDLECWEEGSSDDYSDSIIETISNITGLTPQEVILRNNEQSYTAKNKMGLGYNTDLSNRLKTDVTEIFGTNFYLYAIYNPHQHEVKFVFIENEQSY